MSGNSASFTTVFSFVVLNRNRIVFATAFGVTKVISILSRDLGRFWFVNQTKSVVLARSKFVCVPGQIKMAPPLGPLLAQFLSGLAAEFITFLSTSVDMFQKTVVKAQELALSALSVKLFKFKADELRLSLYFNVTQSLFQVGVLQEVVEAWKNSFNLLDNLVFDNKSTVNVEQTRLFLKNSLKLELQGFLLLNLYLLFCGWFGAEFFTKNGQPADEFLVFSKKSINVVLPLFRLDNNLSPFNGLNYDLFVQLFRATTVIYRGLSLCFNRRGSVLINRHTV